MSRINFVREPNLAIYQDSNKRELLRKIVIFKDLSPKLLGVIEQRIQVLELRKGERIISEDEVAKGVYLVQSGSLKLTKEDENGNEIIVCVKQKGDIFAEACLFTQKEEYYLATATMLETGTLFFLDKLDLEKEISQHPELAMQMISYMSDALRDMTSQLRDTALLDVYAKTVRTLERVGRKFNQDGKRWGIEIPLTVQEFATIVGTTRESVSRVFSRLKKEEMIEIRSRKIIILDTCKFCTLMQRDY
ncbi:Crp/Fnr family transcriptional regulator [Bacillus sp. FJAT-29814]|uniref:Crp/Fnr family transcriptional regulator n=1 Tax=Bacillus sp. FJAT-29814 TaxID=1729688 RepID=UPI0009EAF6AD|nr:Crp/Fnr family transcriptional regulator [Bacillus sp. FJAT-29814]